MTRHIWCFQYHRVRQIFITFICSLFDSQQIVSGLSETASHICQVRRLLVDFRHLWLTPWSRFMRKVICRLERTRSTGVNIHARLTPVKQETQLSLTNRATRLRKCNGMAYFLQTFSSPFVLPCWIWSFCVEWCRHKYRRTQKIGGALEHHSLEMGGVADPQDTRMCIRYGMCYHVRFVSSATKGICINSKDPQNWGALGPRPLGVGVADHLIISSLAVLPCEIW